MPSTEPGLPRSADDDGRENAAIAVELLSAVIAGGMTRHAFQDLKKRMYAAQRTAEERAAEAHGQANAIMIVLDERGVAVPDDIRDHVLECTDPTQLNVWLRQACTATTIADVIRE